MFCSKCGNKSPAEARFCRKCGTKVINNASSYNDTAHLHVHPGAQAAMDSGANVPYPMPAPSAPPVAAPYMGPPPPVTAPSISPPPPAPVVPTPTPQPPVTAAPNITPPPSILAAAKSEPQPPIAEVLNVVAPPPPPKRGSSADYNIAPNNTEDATPASSSKPRPPRTHMAAPTSSGDMDYTFYPGQTAASPPPADSKPKDTDADLVEYPIQPVLPKPADLIPRVTSGGSYSGYHTTPKLPEPQPQNGDITNFPDYQILPASYEPAAPPHVYQPHEPVAHIPETPSPQSHVHMPTEPIPPYEQAPQHIPVPIEPVHQHIPAPIEPVHQHIPAPIEPIPQHTPVPIAPAPQRVNMPAIQAPSMAQQYQPMPPMPYEPVQNIAPAPQIQPLVTTPPAPEPQEQWRSYDEYDEKPAKRKSRKKSKAPMVISVIAVLLIVAGAGLLLFSRSITVSHDQVVGTWTPPMAMGMWIERIEFMEDGTGRHFEFNSEHNVIRQEVPFEWELVRSSLLGNTRMRKSIWPEEAELTIQRRSRPIRLRYRFENSEIWHALEHVQGTNP